jgi:hypothetical protein
LAALSNRPTTLTKKAAQEKLIELIENGSSVTRGLEVVDKAYKTYEEWRRNDAAFKAKVDHAKTMAKRAPVVRGEKIPFEDWRLKYLGQRTYWHQLQWIDVLEGREPRDLHPAQTWSRGTNRNRVLVNCPPEHAKSQTITIDYITYRICMDPSFRSIIISAGQTMASRMVYGIKSRLTNPRFRDLQMAYGPEGGWKATADAWTKTEIYLDADNRDGIEKDPTVQALGWQGQIYGARANLIVLDDGVDKKNVRQWEAQKEWLDTEPATRLGTVGKFLVIGTRMAPVDLYSELMNPEHYTSGNPPWNYLASPAILEFGEAEDGSDHKTLWPYSDRSRLSSAADGDACSCGQPYCVAGLELDGEQVYPWWDGLHIQQMRDGLPSSRFALVYQQSGVLEDAIFPEHALEESTNNRRMPGLMQPDTVGHPPGGMHGMRVIATCDPAVKGAAAIIVGAVSTKPVNGTHKRYLLNAWNIKAPTPQRLKEMIFKVTEDYGVDVWRVEKTGLLQFFTQDAELRAFMAQRGVQFREHNTNKSTKWDPAYGVASLAPLFGQWDRATGPHGEVTSEWREISPPLIELPRGANGGIRDLKNQLVIWSPDLDPTKIPCDLVMALWFFEIEAREVTRRGMGKLDPFKGNKNFTSSRTARRLSLVGA